MNNQREERDEFDVFKVVVNDERQYSIWRKDKKNPIGWSDVDKEGTKGECIRYIDDVWNDMRPLSLRLLMESAE